MALSPSPDRIPCLNPRCRRTASREKYPECDEILCGKCWRVLPIAIRNRDRQLHRRERRLLSLIDRKIALGQISRAEVRYLQEICERGLVQQWQRIRNYFQRPERPVGLEGFLQEVGL